MIGGEGDISVKIGARWKSAPRRSHFSSTTGGPLALHSRCNAYPISNRAETGLACLRGSNFRSLRHASPIFNRGHAIPGLHTSIAIMACKVPRHHYVLKLRHEKLLRFRKARLGSQRSLLVALHTGVVGLTQANSCAE
jgi:hypothetical protein